MKLLRKTSQNPLKERNAKLRKEGGKTKTLRTSSPLTGTLIWDIKQNKKAKIKGNRKTR